MFADSSTWVEDACEVFSLITWVSSNQSDTRLIDTQFVIFNKLSYCFEETIGFDVKASFASRPKSRLTGHLTNQVI